MNQELFEKSKSLESQIKNLRQEIKNCDAAIKMIDYCYIILASDQSIEVSEECGLYEEDVDVIREGICAVLQNRVKEAEAELEGLLPENVRNEQNKIIVRRK